MNPDDCSAVFCRPIVLIEWRIDTVDRSSHMYCISLLLGFVAARFFPFSILNGSKDYYYNARDRIATPPSLKDRMKHSAYKDANNRKTLIRRHNYNNPARVQEWTAAHYGKKKCKVVVVERLSYCFVLSLLCSSFTSIAMVEEIDHYVGQLLQILREAGIAKNTMVVFTTDHGEMLG
jgi:hypothetical protein